MSTFRQSLLFLLIAVFTQGCVRVGLDAPVVPTAGDVEPTQTEALALATATPSPSPIIIPTLTEIIPTLLPRIKITAVKGNLFIRRGPGLEYNAIAVLYKDTSTEAIARDVLSNWVQVFIPDSEKTGWVSIQTGYSTIGGDLNNLPDFTFTDWPVPVYIKNCTEHDMFITPGDIYLPNLYTNAEYKNEVQVNPGSYTAFDMIVPGEPVAQKFELSEGMEAYITLNGLGEKHKCP